MVDTLLAAGAVLHAQTAAPELCFIPLTWSRLWGVTRNPWNLPITVGNWPHLSRAPPDQPGAAEDCNTTS
jgi:Asp-tRNA(Asn)/Glu-tRNA(Gln) amidotransferase A subunit family amidase